jgi:hypothetical protein
MARNTRCKRIGWNEFLRFKRYNVNFGHCRVEIVEELLEMQAASDMRHSAKTAWRVGTLARQRRSVCLLIFVACG